MKALFAVVILAALLWVFWITGVFVLRTRKNKRRRKSNK